MQLEQFPKIRDLYPIAHRPNETGFKDFLRRVAEARELADVQQAITLTALARLACAMGFDWLTSMSERVSTLVSECFLL